MKVHAEIEYTTEDGGLVHSDICPPDHDSINMIDEEWRKFLHDSLDEWLDRSSGTGQFYIRGEVEEVEKEVEDDEVIFYLDQQYYCWSIYENEDVEEQYKEFLRIRPRLRPQPLFRPHLRSFSRNLILQEADSDVCYILNYKEIDKLWDELQVSISISRARKTF